VIEYGDQRFIQQICVDMSDRQRLEDQLIQSEKMAAIGQLAAGIAHEIRNPLAIIMNALYDLARSSTATTPRCVRIYGSPRRRWIACRRSSTACSSFRVTRGGHRDRRHQRPAAKDASVMSKYLQNSDVRVVTELADIGPCPANQNALRQIFLNLITNAVQAMPHAASCAYGPPLPRTVGCDSSSATPASAFRPTS